MSQYVVRRDTQAWVLQVWVSFGIAALLCVGGTWSISADDTDKAFMAIGFFFSLFAVLALSKTIRDNQPEVVDTAGWRMATWAAFAISSALTAWGLFTMKIPGWEKAFMVAAWLFLVSSAFTLAKTLRDRHDADLVESAQYKNN